MPNTTSGEQVSERSPQRVRRFGRRAAILVIVAIVGVLALGWLADSLGQFAPRTTFRNGETQQAGLYQVALTIDSNPAQAGEQVALTAHVEDNNGHPATDLTARLVMTMPTMDMAAIETPLTVNANGTYAARTIFPMSGAWLVRVELTPPGATPLRADFDVPVRQSLS